MKIKTDVGQIFLTHPKNENFTTLFTEAFQKQGETVELFAVIELENPAEPHELRLLLGLCEKFAGQIIGALKKIYITAPVVDGSTFEKALAAVNAAIARSGRQTKPQTFTKMNVGLAALYRSELWLSVSGNAQVLLWRGGEIVDLAQDLTAGAPAAGKTFQSYSQGGLARHDRVILSTKQLLNYVSLTLLGEYLQEGSVAVVCREIIAALGEQKSVGFASFIFEIAPAAAGAPAPAAAQTPKPAAYRPALAVAGAILLAAGDFLWRGLRGLFSLASFRGRSGRHGRAGVYRKWIFGLLSILLLALLANIGIGLARKSLRQRAVSETQSLEAIEELVEKANASLIYGDEKSAAAAVTEAANILEENKKSGQEAKRKELQDKIDEIKNKLNKAVVVTETPVLASFESVPTDLIRSPNGVLAWNRDSGRLAHYDFRTGEVRQLLKNQNTSKIAAIAYAGGDIDFIFLDRDGAYFRLDLASEQLLALPGTGPKNSSQFAALGAGDGARLYVLDRAVGQIWRIRMQNGNPGAAETWFKSSQDLGEVTDIAIDGSIYLLRGAEILKFFNGLPQTFQLSPVIPALAEASGVFTSDANKSLYVLDAKNSRLLIFDKNGKLQSQLQSGKFRDAADLYADETAKIIYIIAGGELLQIKMP